MPAALRVHATVDSAGLVQDLESIELGLGRQLSDALLDAAGTVLQAVPGFTPYDEHHRADRADHLPHLRDTYSLQRAGGTAVGIVSSHPGAKVHEHGGTIAPRGVPIRIRESGMAEKAGEAKAGEFERAYGLHVDALIARYGL